MHSFGTTVTIEVGSELQFDMCARFFVRLLLGLGGIG